MSTAWFGKKRIGFGYRPINLMGWIVSTLFVAVVVIGALVFLDTDPPNPVAFIILLVIDVVALILVIRAKLETTL